MGKIRRHRDAISSKKLFNQPVAASMSKKSLKRRFHVSENIKSSDFARKSEDRFEEDDFEDEPVVRDDLLSKRFKRSLDVESPLESTGRINGAEPSGTDDSDDESYKSVNSSVSGNFDSSLNQRTVKMLIHQGTMFLLLHDYASVAIGGSGYLVILQGNVGLYGVKVGAPEGLVLPIESVPGSAILLTNRGSKGQCPNFRENFERLNALRASSKAEELLARYPHKTILAITSRRTEYTTLKPKFSSADDSTPENSWDSCGVYMVPTDQTGIERNKKLDDLCANILKQAVREPVRALFAGPKDSGKSSTIRALCNRFFFYRARKSQTDKPETSNIPILVLDLDPGQTEFTPPGCVSLVEITQPLMGPPSSHQIKPEKSFLVGGATAGSHPDMYVEAVRSLMLYMNEVNSSSYILLINTMGWLNGIGKLLFANILQLTDPSSVVSLDRDFDLPKIAWPAKLISTDFPVFHLPRIKGMFAKDIFSKPLKAAAHREAAIISYLGGTSILAKHPVVIPFHKLALHEISSSVPKTEILNLLNANFVALCRVPNSAIMKNSKIPLLNKFIQPHKEPGDERFECLGFGIVRCIDPQQKLIYVVTPEPDEIFERVNALIYNGIPLPTYFFVNQIAKNVPYVQSENSNMIQKCQPKSDLID